MTRGWSRLDPPATSSPGSIRRRKAKTMTRRGYNSAWMWKRWAQECGAAADAIRDGHPALALAHLDLADDISDSMARAEQLQLELFQQMLDEPRTNGL